MTPDTIRLRLDSLAKPPGSLGRLEELAARLCLVQGTLTPVTSPRRVVLFAGDHGVVAEGVTAWPAEVTGLMIRAIVSGGAASAVLAKSTNTELFVVDVGSASDALSPRTGYVDARVGRGTRNLFHEPAMTVAEFDAACVVGEEQAKRAVADGIRVVAAGEMGIGNSTSASCLTALLTDMPAVEVVGGGAGAVGPTLERKRDVVHAAVETARAIRDPAAAIASIAGFEIAAMAGFFRQAAAAGLTLVLDGFIATSAALIAERLWPGVQASMIAAHLSAEPGHAAALRRLGLKPFLDTWQMRLGEGTGAILLMPLLDAAAAIIAQMATLDELGANRDGR